LETHRSYRSTEYTSRSVYSVRYVRFFAIFFPIITAELVQSVLYKYTPPAKVVLRRYIVIFSALSFGYFEAMGDPASYNSLVVAFICGD